MVRGARSDSAARRWAILGLRICNFAPAPLPPVLHLRDACHARVRLSRAAVRALLWWQARDTAPNAAAVKELDLDLSLWQPLIVDRQFVSWLVKEPTEQVPSLHTAP